MKTSDQIKMIRKMENLTQAEFAKELGVSTATIASIENDSRDIPKTLIKKLVKEKNINANWLITGEEPVFLENKETKQSIIAAQRIPLLRQGSRPSHCYQQTDRRAIARPGVERAMVEQGERYRDEKEPKGAETRNRAHG